MAWFLTIYAANQQTLTRTRETDYPQSKLVGQFWVKETYTGKQLSSRKPDTLEYNLTNFLWNMYENWSRRSKSQKTIKRWWWIAKPIKKRLKLYWSSLSAMNRYDLETAPPVEFEVLQANLSSPLSRFNFHQLLRGFLEMHVNTSRNVRNIKYSFK